MKYYTLILLLTLAIPSSHALEGKLANDTIKEVAKGCRADVKKVNPQAGKKATEDYCQCYAKELVGNLDDADTGALLSDKETPHFTAVANQAATLCSRTFLQATAEEKRKKSKYVELPDINMEGLTRVKSGVFATKVPEGWSAMTDSESVYVIRRDDLFCGWASESNENRSTRETISAFKISAPVLMKTFLGPDAQMTHFEESTVRNLPAILIEASGQRQTGMDTPKQINLMMTVVMEVPNSANVIGFCMAEAEHFERLKSTIKKLSMAAMSSRSYKN
ncbi:MAG: hypothetical protein WCV99_22590 [Sterolibacterium sp.]|jgi:hypothetical protein